MEGRRDLGKWGCSFLPSFHWDGKVACYMVHWKLYGCRGSSGQGCVSWQSQAYSQVEGLFAYFTGPFWNSFLPVCCWYPDQVWGLSRSSMRKLPCCFWLSTGTASKVEPVLFAACQRLLEEVAGSLLALTCNWCLRASALHDSGFTDPAMGDLWYKVLTASFTSIFCGIWCRNSL